ncbi:MAG TPA: DUF63 family protein, partial [Candidatus Thermoplasmatota archaeon]|nr:DUF63 family protein [Candidatus Thermoplasmatota archaeon]
MTDAGSPATPETGPHAPGRDAEPHGGALSGATSTPATAAMMGSGADVGAHEEGRIGHPAPKPEPAPTAAPSGAAGPRQPPLLDRLPLWIVPAILLGVPLLVWGASQVAPGVYEDFVFPYYWGPIKADAHDFTYLCLGPDGEFGDRELGYRACEQAGGSIAQSGYNAINTATWAVLLLVSIAGAAQMLRRFSTPMGNRLIIGATLWTVAGSLWHALEDTRLIEPPLQYLFITPPIYLLFAAFGILAFLVGKYLEGVQAKAGPARALQKLWLLMAIAPMGSLLLWAREWDGVVRHLHPATVAALWAAAFLILRRRTERKGRLDAEDLVVV